MGYALSPTISFTILDWRAIFLDLARDRYFCLARDQQDALNTLLDGASPTTAEQETLAPLVTSGILRQVEGQDRLMACTTTTPPTESLIDRRLPKARPWQVAAASAHLLSARTALRSRPLCPLLEQLRRRKLSLTPADFLSERLLTVASAFEATSLLFAPLRQCLPRSLAMAHRLCSLGVSFDLVIGVATNPFSAHCWLQHGNLVINDRLEKVCGYAPVLIL